MITYEIPRGTIIKLADRDEIFLTFDKFPNLVKIFRDDYLACNYVEGFLWDVGVKYNVWTRDESSRYYRHLFFDAMKKPIKISFKVPHLTKNATVPLDIAIFDEDGVYYTMSMLLAFDTMTPKGWKVTSWRKIEPIKDCVIALADMA